MAVLPESQTFDPKIGCQVTRLRGDFETESPLFGVDGGERIDACGTVGGSSDAALATSASRRVESASTSGSVGHSLTNIKSDSYCSLTNSNSDRY